jgi:hypothetical protein
MLTGLSSVEIANLYTYVAQSSRQHNVLLPLVAFRQSRNSKQAFALIG